MNENFREKCQLLDRSDSLTDSVNIWNVRVVFPYEFQDNHIIDERKEAKYGICLKKKLDRSNIMETMHRKCVFYLIPPSPLNLEDSKVKRPASFLPMIPRC